MDLNRLLAGYKGSIIGTALLLTYLLSQLNLDIPVSGATIIVALFFYVIVDSRYKTWSELRGLPYNYRPIKILQFALSIALVALAIFVQLQLLPAIDLVSVTIAGIYIWHWFRGERNRYTLLAIGVSFIAIAVALWLIPAIRPTESLLQSIIGAELIVAGAIEHFEIKRWFAAYDASALTNIPA